jgi:DNA-binding transcriptional MerR regulator
MCAPPAALYSNYRQGAQLTLFTVSQIARQVASTPERRVAVMERIRHWTREGLIAPVGEKNPGTGRHRRYDENAVAAIAVLNAVASLGIQVAVLRQVLSVAMQSINKWRGKYREEKGDVYLEIYDLHGTAYVSERKTEHLEGRYVISAQSVSGASLIINISKILRRIRLQTK